MPRHSGRKPFGSRTPIKASSVSSSSENAPWILRQRFAERVEHVACLRSRQQVKDDFAVAGGLKDRALAVPGPRAAMRH